MTGQNSTSAVLLVVLAGLGALLLWSQKASATVTTTADPNAVPGTAAQNHVDAPVLPATPHDTSVTSVATRLATAVAAAGPGFKGFVFTDKAGSYAGQGQIGMSGSADDPNVSENEAISLENLLHGQATLGIPVDQTWWGSWTAPVAGQTSALNTDAQNADIIRLIQVQEAADAGTGSYDAGNTLPNGSTIPAPYVSHVV